MNRKKLIEYRGILKYVKNKYIKYIDLLDEYIQRIDENTAEFKDSSRADYEEEFNKDLLIEIEYLLAEIKESDVK